METSTIIPNWSRYSKWKRNDFQVPDRVFIPNVEGVTFLAFKIFWLKPLTMNDKKV